MEVQFLTNLRPLTAAGSFRHRLRPAGYLAPPNALTAGTLRFARTVRASGRTLVLDNGLFDDIGRIAGDLAAEAAPLTTRIQATQNRLGHPLRPGDVVDADIKAVNDLAARAASAAEQIEGHASAYLSIKPTGLVGAEDITVAIWLRLGLDRPQLNPDRGALRRRNRDVALRVATARAEHPEVTILGVASALDYDTAYDAGREFAAAGLDAAAMGFGAFMADRTSRDVIKIKGRWRRLAGSSPQRYLRTAAVARGFFDGWRAESASAPAWFHFLGLGLPIMVGIATLAAHSSARVTFDATSPIKDVNEGMFYTSRPSYLKIHTWRAARRLARDGRERWQCPCPFCRAFSIAHPFDYAGGATWWATTGSTEVRLSDLGPAGALHDVYPLLAQPAAGVLGRAITEARIGHNHWALERIAEELSVKGTTATELTNHMQQIVQAYERAAADERNAQTVRLAFDIARGVWP